MNDLKPKRQIMRMRAFLMMSKPPWGRLHVNVIKAQRRFIKIMTKRQPVKTMSWEEANNFSRKIYGCNANDVICALYSGQKLEKSRLATGQE